MEEVRRERQREADSERDREGNGERDSEAEKGGRRGCASWTDRASEKETGKRPSARDSEGGKEWSRRGPIEAQREIERGKRNREPKSFERVRRSGRDRF